MDSAQHGLLAEAFSAFISASARLEFSYRELQAQVAELSLALLERNEALNASRSENRTIGLTLQRILDTIPCGVLVVDSEDVISLANPEAARLLALSAAQMPTLSSIETLTGLDLASAPAVTDGAEQELSFETSAGIHWISVRRVDLPGDDLDGQDRTGDAILTVQDISARKHAERERETARDAAALAQVSALLAHEIRNPLAGLELFAGLIADNPERRDEWLSHLRAGIRSLSGTVNNVLTLHGGGAPTMERLELAVEARLAANFLQPLAQRANVALVLEGDSCDLWIRANKTAFHQLLLNLCSNALRHTASHGSVCIRCESPAPGIVTVAVIDNGCGIPAEHLPRLFEGGFSGSGTTPGLGLAVCERIMRQHGGAIRVESLLGYGSTFTLEFQQA